MNFFTKTLVVPHRSSSQLKSILVSQTKGYGWTRIKSWTILSRFKSARTNKGYLKRYTMSGDASNG